MLFVLVLFAGLGWLFAGALLVQRFVDEARNSVKVRGPDLDDKVLEQAATLHSVLRGVESVIASDGVDVNAGSALERLAQELAHALGTTYP